MKVADSDIRLLGPPGEWKFDALSATVAEAVVTLDRHGRILAWNRGAEKLFGHTAGEVLGCELFGLIADTTTPPIPAGGRLGEVAGHNLDLVARHKDGRDLPVGLTLFGADAGTGEILAVVRTPCAGGASCEVLTKQRDEIAEAFFRRQRQDSHLIWQLMHHDALTGLPNRLLIVQKLARVMMRAARQRRRAAVLVVDIGHFKHVNETLGHVVGDFVIITLAARLREFIAPVGKVGRLEGAEFAVVLPDLRRGGEAEAMAQKLLGIVAEPVAVAGHELVLTASIGVSVFPDDAADADSLMSNAGAAMGLAQKEGGNAWRSYAAEHNAFAVARLALEEDLRRALARQEFEVHYQPQVDLRSGTVDGAEALVRWRRPGQGLVSPAQFIPLAEETGLIVPIGEWVLQAACAQLGKWQQAVAPHLRMAVNLSARQFQCSDLAGKVPQVVGRSGIRPQSLELEITESMLMQDVDMGKAMLQELSRQGVRLAIDDFGTGYSSLNYLKRFPIDTLKIDQCFVRHLPQDSGDAAIVRAVIALAHGLDLEVVAEGVETQTQLDFMHEFGCDKVQGYFFSPPVEPDKFEQLLATAYCG